MAESVVDNLGLRKHRRYRTVLALTYNTPPQLMGEFCLGLRSLLEASPRVAHERSLVEFHDFGDCSLSVMLNCFIEADDWPTEMSVRAELNLAILVLADKVGVRFAFPTRTIHVASMPSDVGQPT
jgi:MscS family membrane protein